MKKRKSQKEWSTKIIPYLRTPLFSVLSTIRRKKSSSFFIHPARVANALYRNFFSASFQVMFGCFT